MNTDLATARDAVATDQPSVAIAVPTPATRSRHGARLVQTAPFLALVLLFVTLSAASGAFLTKQNLLNVLEANAAIGIAACAGTLVIVAGSLDVSVGAIYALSGVLAAKVAMSTGSVPLALLAGLGAGAALGLLNGIVVTLGRVNSFVATLAAGIVYQSVAQVLATGDLLTPDAHAYTQLGRGSLLGIQYSVLLFALSALVCGLLLARGRVGRHVTVVGANAEAARLSGVPVRRARTTAFVLSGLAAALAALVVTSRSGQVEASIGGTPYVLSVIAAIAVGGTSLRGGEGSVTRTVVGVLFLGLVTNGLSLLNVDPTYYQLFTGLLILAAIGLGTATARLSRDG
jgi:ribose transport system permease protein